MPTYEYVCRECGERLEAVQSFTDDPLTECPNCGGSLKKVFGAVGIVFKGSGFYKTDSRGSSASVTPAASETKSDSTSASTASTEKAPAAPAPAPSTPAPSTSTP